MWPSQFKSQSSYNAIPYFVTIRYLQRNSELLERCAVKQLAQPIKNRVVFLK